MIKRTFLLLLSIALSGCNLMVPSNLFRPISKLDNCVNVYSDRELDILSKYFPKESSPYSRMDSSRIILVFDSTNVINAEQIIRRIRDLRDTLKVQDLISRFNELNARRYAFCPQLVFKSRILTIRRSEFDTAFKEYGLDAWRSFYKQFPGPSGIRSFSRVAFSSDSTLAMIYFEEHCGELCGEGTFHIFKYCDGEWLMWRSIFKWAS